MKHQTLVTLTKRWGEKIGSACQHIDTQLAGRRGPTGAVPTYALIAGLVYLALENKPVHLVGLHRELTTARRRDLTLLGLDTWPTYRQLCYQLERLHQLAETAPQRDQVVQQLLDTLVPPSATDAGHTTMWAIDTHLFEAWVNQGTANSADPDATWRVLETHKHKNRPVLGYHLVAAVRTGTTEVCDRITITTANADDAPPAAALTLAMQRDGHPVQRILADRGFTQKPQSFLDPIRNAGIHLTFDLKDNDHGVTGTLHGNLVIDGWPYSPAIPKHLRVIPKPKPGSTKADWAKFQTKIAARDPYAWLAHGKPGPAKTRAASPASRNKLHCKIAQNTAPAAAPTCRIKHAAGEACAMTTMTFDATTAPRTYQYPVWGTPDWQQLWKQRSAVERFFGHLQAPAGIGFDYGRFQVRRLPKVALITAAFVIATNISLIESAARRSANVVTKTLTIRGRTQQLVPKTQGRTYTVRKPKTTALTPTAAPPGHTP